MQNVFVMLNIDCVLIAVAFRRGRALAMGSAPNTQHVSTRTRRHTRTHARTHTHKHTFTQMQTCVTYASGGPVLLQLADQSRS